MDVDAPPPLVLDHLGVRQAGSQVQLPGGDTGQAGQGPANVDRGASPELTGQGVPDDRAVIVVAGGAQRLTKQRVVGLVHVPAGLGTSVGTRGRIGGWGTRSIAVASAAHAVDPAEARRCQRHGDSGVDVGTGARRTAVGQPGGDDPSGVALVDGGAGRAAGGPAGAMLRIAELPH